VHRAIKPRVRPLLPRISTHLAPLLEIGVCVISLIETPLQFFIAGAGSQAAKHCHCKSGDDGFHGAEMEVLFNVNGLSRHSRNHLNAGNVASAANF
jgi:hypothetical protein